MCRPRKVILLVNANEAMLGMQRFILETRGYRVETARDATAAMACFASGVDLVIGFAALLDGDWAVMSERMKNLHAEVPILLVGSRDVGAANVAWCPLKMTTEELLDRARVLIRRKRGPRKSVMSFAPAMAGD